MTNSAEIQQARRSDEIEASVACTLVRAAWVGVPVLVADQAIKLVSRADVPLCAATVAECAQVSPVGPLTTMSIGQAGAILSVVESVGLWGLIGLVALASVPLYAHQARPGSWAVPLAIGLQLAGALAMVLDWLLLGGVTVPLLANDAPLLNPAESALTLGTVLALLDRLGWLAETHRVADATRAVRSYWLIWRGLGRPWPHVLAS